MISKVVPAATRVTTELDWPGLARTVSRAPPCVATRTRSPIVRAADCPALFPLIGVDVGARAVAEPVGDVTDDAPGGGVAVALTGVGVGVVIGIN